MMSKPLYAVGSRIIDDSLQRRDPGPPKETPPSADACVEQGKYSRAQSRVQRARALNKGSPDQRPSHQRAWNRGAMSMIERPYYERCSSRTVMPETPGMPSSLPDTSCSTPVPAPANTPDVGAQCAMYWSFHACGRWVRNHSV